MTFDGRVASLIVLWVIAAGCGRPDSGRSIASAGTPLRIEPASQVIESTEKLSPDGEVVLRLFNDSKTEIGLLGVESSCGCTLAEPLEIETLAAGQSIALRLRVAMPTAGVKSVTVTARFRSQGETSTTAAVLELKGKPEVPPFFHYSQLSIRLVGKKPGENLSQRFELMTCESPEAPFWVSGASTGTEEFGVQLVGVPKEIKLEDPRLVRRTYVFLVEATMPTVPRSMRGNITIATTSESDYRSVIPIVIEYQPAIRSVPPVIVIPANELVGAGVLKKQVAIICEEPFGEFSFDENTHGISIEAERVTDKVLRLSAKIDLLTIQHAADNCLRLKVANEDVVVPIKFLTSSQ